MNTQQELQKLHDKFSKRYKGKVNSEQMCLMWSTHNPPDVIAHTDQIYSIEEKFNVELSEEDAMKIYDMDVEDAAKAIDTLLRQQR